MMERLVQFAQDLEPAQYPVQAQPVAPGLNPGTLEDQSDGNQASDENQGDEDPHLFYYQLIAAKQCQQRKSKEDKEPQETIHENRADGRGRLAVTT